MTIPHVSSLLDQQLFFFFNADRGMAWLDTLMAVFSSLDFWFPLFVAGGVLLFWRGGFRARSMLVCLLLSVGLMEGLFINPLKKAFGRPRPNEVLAGARIISIAPAPSRSVSDSGNPTPSLVDCAGDFLGATPQVRALLQGARVKPANPATPPKPGKSFPSGHTSNMFCFATVLTAFYRSRGAWFFLPAALVAISRVATGAHWPSDVILTAMFSVALTLGLLALYGWLWRTFAPKLIPSIAARHPRLVEPR